MQNVLRGSTGESIPLLIQEVNDVYSDWEKVGTYLLDAGEADGFW